MVQSFKSVSETQVCDNCKLLLIKPGPIKNSIKGFRRAYKWRGLYPRGVIMRTEKGLPNEL